LCPNYFVWDCCLAEQDQAGFYMLFTTLRLQIYITRIYIIQFRINSRYLRPNPIVYVVLVINNISFMEISIGNSGINDLRYK